MKVVVLHGSARVGGDTDTLAEQFLLGLDQTGPHEITHFRPIEMHIEHCRACMSCADGSGCIIDDAMQDVYPAFCDADLVVMATPMFWGYMTSQLKTLFDRLEAVVSERCFGGKDFVLLIGYRQYFGSMVAWLDRIAGLSSSQALPSRCRRSTRTRGWTSQPFSNPSVSLKPRSWVAGLRQQEPEIPRLGDPPRFG